MHSMAQRSLQKYFAKKCQKTVMIANNQQNILGNACSVYIWQCIMKVLHCHGNMYSKKHNYLIRTNFREALISRFLRFSRFSKNREIKVSQKKGYAKIKHAKFNTL